MTIDEFATIGGADSPNGGNAAPDEIDDEETGIQPYIADVQASQGQFRQATDYA